MNKLDLIVHHSVKYFDKNRGYLPFNTKIITEKRGEGHYHIKISPLHIGVYPVDIHYDSLSEIAKISVIERMPDITGLCSKLSNMDIVTTKKVIPVKVIKNSGLPYEF